MLHDEWRSRLTSLIHFGHHMVPRGQPTLEEVDMRLLVTNTQFNLLDVPSRKLNYRFAVAEWIWMAFGRSDVESLALYNSVMRQFSDDGISLAGAYGPHIRAQYRKVVDKLNNDPNTRQAVIEIPRPRNANTKDEPCTLSFQFLIRPNDLGEDQLNLIATMRSSDAWLGIPYDVFTFTQFQNSIAGELGLTRGWLSLRMGSSHLYERDLRAAWAVLDSSDDATLRSPNLPGPPPAWLEDVLFKRDATLVPNDAPLVWRGYAAALLARTSDEARGHLAALANA